MCELLVVGIWGRLVVMVMVMVRILGYKIVCMVCWVFLFFFIFMFFFFYESVGGREFFWRGEENWLYRYEIVGYGCKVWLFLFGDGSIVVGFVRIVGWFVELLSILCDLVWWFVCVVVDIWEKLYRKVCRFIGWCFWLILEFVWF